MCDKYEPNKGLSIAKGKCPQCQSGKMFNYPFYNLKRFMDMDATCKVCGLKYEIEPGFFWGAMYVSYALTVGLMLVLGGFILWVSNGKADFWGYVIPIISALLASSPLTYRYARVLMLYFFSPIRFNPDMAKK
ncbi:MAG: DUF983 domain-containing protein [Bacteroidia bacterium]|nr:DUF983 domain-containing protein [Bacteroidia bacterium]MCF8445508.1 DUF983 domain-containing protein [Bacteroidia bacterium]